MAHGSSSGSITKTRKYESTKKSRTGTLPCLGCQRPAANAAFFLEWTPLNGLRMVLDLDGWREDLSLYAVLLGHFAATARRTG